MASLWSIFYSFLKIGAFTFGGGYAMIPLIEAEMIQKRGWLSREEFINQLTIAQSVPGPIALNTAVFVGYKTRGLKGALAALVGVIIPSFVIILLIATYFTDFKDNPTVAAAFKGMRPAVVALIAQLREVFHGAQSRLDLSEVCNRISAVASACRALQQGHKMYIIESAFLQIIQMLLDSLKSSGKTVGVHEHAQHLIALIPLRNFLAHLVPLFQSS